MARCSLLSSALRGHGALVLLAGSLATTPARAAGPAASAAPTKNQCVAANTEGQDLRKAAKLAAARAQLVLCAQDACPALVRDDCARRLDELEKAQPTIVFVPKDAYGGDASGVAVTVDGNVLTGHLNGGELPIDPGEHVFVFTAPGRPAVTKTLVVSIGEKERREAVVVGGGTPPPVNAPASREPAHLVVAASDGAAIALDGAIVAQGRLDAREPPGPHRLRVTAAGKNPYEAEVDLHEGETRTLDVSMVAERSALVPIAWIAGGVALVAGAIVGGYFLFRSSPGAPSPPPDPLGSVQLTLFR